MSINVSNLHPNWRALRLNYIREVRQTLRTGRYTFDCKRIIKEQQRELSCIRAAVRASKAA